jgi:hypothetical protein
MAEKEANSGSKKEGPPPDTGRKENREAPGTKKIGK